MDLALLYTNQTASHKYNLSALANHRVFMRLTLAGTSLFLVVYLYTYLGFSLALLALLFGALYATLVIVTPLCLKILQAIGARTTLLLSLLALVASYGSLAAAAYSGGFLVQGVWWFFIYAALYRALYRIPYELERVITAPDSQSLERIHKTRQLQFAAVEVAVAIMPLVGGVIVAAFGIGGLMLVSLVEVICAAVPLFFIDTAYVDHPWSFTDFVEEIFGTRHRSLLATNMLEGMQSATLLILWPVFLFTFVAGSYVSLGILMTLTLSLVLLFRGLMRRGLKRLAGRYEQLYIGIIGSTAWISRALTGTPFDVILTTVYHGAGYSGPYDQVDVFTSEQRADDGVYVDELTIIKEVGLNLGRALLLLSCAAITYFVGAYAGFVATLFLASWAALALGLARQYR